MVLNKIQNAVVLSPGIVEEGKKENRVKKERKKQRKKQREKGNINIQEEINVNVVSVVKKENQKKSLEKDDKYFLNNYS